MIVDFAPVPRAGPYGGSGRLLKGRPMLPSRLPFLERAFRGSFARRMRAPSPFARTSPSALLPAPPPRSSRPRGDRSPPVRVWTPWVADRWRRRRTRSSNHTCSWRRRKAPAAGTRSTQDRASAFVLSYSLTSSLAFALVWFFSFKHLRPRSSLGACLLVTACLPQTYTVALCSRFSSCACACARSSPCSSCLCSLDPLWNCDGQKTLRRSVHSTPNPHLVSPIPTSPPFFALALECLLSKRLSFSLGDSLLVLVCSPRTHAAVLCTRSPGCTIARAPPPPAVRRVLAATGPPPFVSGPPGSPTGGAADGRGPATTPAPGGGARRQPPGPAQPATGPPPLSHHICSLLRLLSLLCGFSRLSTRARDPHLVLASL